MTDAPDGATQRALPADLFNDLQTVCPALIDWVSAAELPEEKVGLREAAGNIGGLLISIMLDEKAEFFHEEAANISELASFFEETSTMPHHKLLLNELRFGAQQALDAQSDQVITYAASA